MNQIEKVPSQRNPRRMVLWIIALYLITTIWFTYIGIYKTIYGIGIYTVFAIQGLGLILFTVLLAVRKMKPMRKLGIAASLIIVLQTIGILGFAVDDYKPTYTIQVPAGMEGYIYIFLTPEESYDVQVDQNGIAYIGNNGEANWDFFRGDEDLSDLFSMAQSNEIVVYEDSGKVMIAYDVVCYPLHEVGSEPVIPTHPVVIPCMDAEAFLELVAKGLVDESLLRKKVWLGSGDGKDWVLDHERSRL